MAQTARAILLANAIATSIFGLRSSIRASHEPGRMARRPIQFRRDIAPLISKRRMSDWPAFEMRPSRCRPPVECCLGTSPSQAAKSRPERKLSIDGAKASMASAVTGPIPGMVCKRRACSSPCPSAGMRRDSSAIRSDVSSIRAS